MSGTREALQRAPYLAAKEKPTRRFHALYDKICREDIMTCAWKQVKANKGSVVNNGQVYWVVDVDIKGYFDNISHEKLMKLVEMRVSDRKVLKLIRGWLKAGVMKDDQFHESEIGSPQGGVISPLLANIYLNYLDTIRARRFAHLGTLVRYADDLVVLCHRKAEAIESIRVLKAVFQKLELTMNTEKSRLVNLWTCERDQGFDFLSRHLRRMPVMRKGGKEARILRCFPSRKAMKKMRAKVKEATASRTLLRKHLKELVKTLNPKIIGWRNCYATVDGKTANR